MKKLIFLLSLLLLCICFVGCGGDNDDFLQELFAAQERHPDLVNEIWFGGSSIDGVSVTEAKARQNLTYREQCRKLGIDFSYQQGITLNYIEAKIKPEVVGHATPTEQAQTVTPAPGTTFSAVEVD